MAGKWIQEMGLKKGSLRKTLGIPKGQKIPLALLESKKRELELEGEKGELSPEKSTMLKRINLALTFNKMGR